MNILNRFFEKNKKQDDSSIIERITNLIKRESFYIILFLCVCIVAVTSVLVTKFNIERLRTSHMQGFPEIEEGVGELFTDEYGTDDSLVTVEEFDDVEVSGAQAEQGTSSVLASDPASKNISDTAQSGAVNSGGKTRIIGLPVKGKVGMGYAADTLVYSKTLEQYMTHCGIDIIAPEGTPVTAALDGEVIEVVVDSGFGITIALAHDGNLITRYANLSTGEMVKLGDKIKKGQTISGVGNSGIFEKSEEPHLHFEVLLDGKHVDPKNYLPIP